jgi:DNA-binding NtrC family response regulator
VIQRGTVRPVGSDREVPVNTRIIAACNQPLEPLVQNGRFRADLYHRLNVVKLKIPPLRQRCTDLHGLILALTCRHAALYSTVEAVDIELLQYLKTQPFPGNVRELENAVQRMLFLKTEGVSLGLSDWMGQRYSDETQQPDPLSEAARAIWEAIDHTGVTYTHALHEIERLVLQAAVSVPGSTRRQIAQRLRTSERTLYYKMRVHRLADSAAS